MKKNFISEIFEVHKLWIITKQLDVLINYLATNFWLNKDDENCSDIWKLILPKIKDFFDCVTTQNVIGIIISTEETHNLQEKNMWNNYESLIEDLLILLLTKDYKVVQDYDEFIKELYEHLTCFEKKIRKCYLVKTNYLFNAESPTEN